MWQSRIVEYLSQVEQWLTLPEVAELLDIKITKVHRLIDESALLAFKIPSVVDPERKVLAVPESFFVTNEDNPRLLEPLKGTIILLKDARYSDEEALGWLLAPQPGLIGSPLEALHAGHKTEIRRRAQALGW